MPPQPSRTAAGPSAVLAAVAAFPDRLRRRAPLSRVCALAAAMLLAIPAVQAQTYTLRVRGGGSGFGGVTVPPTGGQAGMNCAIASGIAAGTCARTYARSTAVTLTATPLAGSVFAGWAGVCASAGSASRCTVSNLTGNVSAVATFEPDCTVTILAASGGSATFADGTPSGACGRSVTVVATPAAGYRFDRWSDGATAATYTFIVASRALVLTPAFVAQCSLTLGASPATGGTVALTSGTLGGDCGRSVSVQATPSPLYRFSAFTEGGGTASTVNPWSFTLATNRSVVATFAAVPQCALTLGTAPGGAATLVSGALTGDCGRAVSLQARPDSGFRFRSWSDGTTTTPYTLTLTAPTLTLTPEFTAQCTLVLAALPADGGTVTLSSGTLTGDCGRSVTAVATARSDFRFTGWSEASASATYTLTVTQSRQPLSAQFASLTSVRVVISGAQGR
ncbi:MAG: hypothetical protein IT355_11245, partial [Gemmatimonadaceae bacterium]|nr:hypothetical protein [Gemmatimonadaceae bacterium]